MHLGESNEGNVGTKNTTEALCVARADVGANGTKTEFNPRRFPFGGTVNLTVGFGGGVFRDGFGHLL